MFVVGKNYRLQDIQLSKIAAVNFFVTATSYSTINAPFGANRIDKNLLSKPPPSRLALRWATFAWPANRSSRASAARAKVGEYRARTGDLLVANQALSQLS